MGSGFEGAISVASPYRYDDYLWTMDMRRPPEEGETGWEEQGWELLGVLVKDDGESALWGHLKPRLLSDKRRLTTTYQKIDQMRENGIKSLLEEFPDLVIDEVSANQNWGHHPTDPTHGMSSACTCARCRFMSALGLPTNKEQSS